MNRDTTKTNSVKQRGAFLHRNVTVIKLLGYFWDSEHYYVLQKDWKPSKYQFSKFMVIQTNDLS